MESHPLVFASSAHWEARKGPAVLVYSGHEKGWQFAAKAETRDDTAKMRAKKKEKKSEKFGGVFGCFR